MVGRGSFSGSIDGQGRRLTHESSARKDRRAGFQAATDHKPASSDDLSRLSLGRAPEGPTGPLEPEAPSPEPARGRQEARWYDHNGHRYSAFGTTQREAALKVDQVLHLHTGNE